MDETKKNTDSSPAEDLDLEELAKTLLEASEALGLSESDLLGKLTSLTRSKADLLLDQDGLISKDDIDFDEITEEELLKIVEHDRRLYDIDTLMMEEEMLEEFGEEYGIKNTEYLFWSLRQDGISGSDEMKEAIRASFEDTEEDDGAIDAEELLRLVSADRESYEPEVKLLERKMMQIFSSGYSSQMVQIAFWMLLQEGITPDEELMSAQLEAVFE